MRPALLIATLVAALSLVSAAPVCTDEQYAKFNTDEKNKCSVQVSVFNVCDDACFDFAFKQASSAPECARYEGGSYTLADDAKHFRGVCMNRYTTMANKYVPRTSSGLSKCTTALTKPWDEKYGRKTPTYECQMKDYKNEPCSADCLKNLEEAVLQAPVCTTDFINNASSGYAYWTGEHQKVHLQTCLVSRSEDVFKNDAMRSYPTSDGKLEVDNEVEPVYTSSDVGSDVEDKDVRTYPPTDAKPASTPLSSTKSPTTAAPTTNPSSSSSAGVVVLGASVIAVASSLVTTLLV